MHKKMSIKDQELGEYLKTHTNKEAASKWKVGERTISRRRKKLGFSHRQLHECKIDLNILAGNLLGDGSLIKTDNPNHHSYFAIKQSTRRTDYLEWLHVRFGTLSLGFKYFTSPKPIRIDNKVIHGLTNSGICEGHELRTRSHPIFTELEKKWYARNENGSHKFKNGKRIKIVPKDLILNWTIVSIWFADDGNNNYNKRQVCLATNSFSIDEVKFLIYRLKTDLNIYARLWWQGEKPTIGIVGQDYDRFIEEIAKRLKSIPCLLYKLKWKPGVLNSQIRLDFATAEEIRVLFQEKWTLKQLAEKFKISTVAIRSILKNKTHVRMDLKLTGTAGYTYK